MLLNLRTLTAVELRRNKLIAVFLMGALGLELTTLDPRASVVILIGAVIAGVLPNDKVAVLWLMPANLLVGDFFLTQPIWQMKLALAIAVLLVRFGLVQDKPIVQEATLPKKYTYDLTGLSRKDKQAFQTAFATGYEEIQAINAAVKDDGQLETIADKYQFELFTDNIMATLAEKPERLVLADEFLYNHVPNILKIVRMYMTVQKQTSVSQVADEQLVQAQNTLVALFKEIKVDYHVLTQVDSQALSEQIAIAQQTMYNRN
ncbi:hypothetical protein C6P08_09575 [Weissella confusa]|uniref:5-bromo-4-chloroindolyl phosphate hydrolase n=1 Tax=Weissella confusa TaxID=1583 RepID=A0AAJ2YXZ9_WEICO|nr:5-bromo-4-chloroindolyl phosphate hydrolysis family protein [Weissella confusa]MBJ7695429.1 hypothetical protein [Weissella confusa]NBA11487.1 hypothetical protein [Weissella confusa]QBZ05410.1 hypothetical protein C6P08_09575 [Weissella confusa]